MSTLKSLRTTLQPEGVIIVLAPQSQSLYGSIDRTLGHKRRFNRADLLDLLKQARFDTQEVHQLNKIGRPFWWLFGTVLGREQISKIALKLFDKTAWFWRRIEFLLPWPGLSLIVVARRSDTI